LVIHVVIVLLLNYHVVHDHTSSYDLPPCLLAPSPSMAPNNSPTRLVHTKCPLHIIPSSFLLFNKPTFFLFFRIADCLHKCGPTKIYNRLNNTLFHGGGHRYHSWPLEHQPSQVERTPEISKAHWCHCESLPCRKRASNLEILRCNRLKYDGAPFRMAMALPL
jgi:hypothetical protein